MCVRDKLSFYDQLGLEMTSVYQILANTLLGYRILKHNKGCQSFAFCFTYRDHRPVCCPLVVSTFCTVLPSYSSLRSPQTMSVVHLTQLSSQACHLSLSLCPAVTRDGQFSWLLSEHVCMASLSFTKLP
ncbi:hypothetical protein RRG08_040744 [Elysia crispata]|uniref:Uncharacterized protein n=1 Tax=Elysia crispata TaxID=231223 RepID=A0AAE1BG68_9GAST|nr:hypothetical protein RRG08_040744 [Elysia crispata]